MLALYMPHMHNSNLETRIAGSVDCSQKNMFLKTWGDLPLHRRVHSLTMKTVILIVCLHEYFSSL